MIDHEESPKKSILSIIINIVIPTLILTKMSSPERLGPVNALFVGLAFPFCFGVYDLVTRKKFNFVSTIGVISVALTGGLALMKLDGLWLAFKEALVPFLIGGFFIINRHSKYNFMDLLLLNPKIIEHDKLLNAIPTDKENDFKKAKGITSWIFLSSFFLSGILQFFLALYIVTGKAGTQEFSEQVGKMTGVSFFVISLPMLVLIVLGFYYFSHQIKKITGEAFDFFMKEDLKK